MNYTQDTIMYNEDKYSNERDAQVSESQLGAALTAQRKMIENLCQEIYLLREQLGPVLILQDEEPGTKSEGAYPSGLCAIAERLYEHGHTLDRATREIVQLRRSLAV